MNDKSEIALLNNQLIESPNFAKDIYTILHNLKHKKYNPSFLVDSIFQLFSRLDPDILDAYYFGLIYGGICTGKIALLQIEMNTFPKKDNEIKGNNEILSFLPKPFSAKFNPTYGSGYNDDGIFKWIDKVEFDLFSIKKKNIISVKKSITIKKSVLPLELGTTSAKTTFNHLIYNKGVARFPYNHTKIIVLYNINLK